ncbi:MAG: hypothetical protein WBB82_03895 [Limnothrix sp.]
MAIANITKNSSFFGQEKSASKLSYFAQIKKGLPEVRNVWGNFLWMTSK